MQIRDATPADAPVIAQLNARAWKEGFRGVVPDAYLAAYDGRPEDRRRHLLEGGEDAINLLATDGESVAGWIEGYPAGDGEVAAYEIRACYVEPANWRKGVGRLLVQSMLDRLEPQRWTSVLVSTARESKASCAFYVGFGFIADGAEIVSDYGGPVPIIRYRLALRLP